VRLGPDAEARLAQAQRNFALYRRLKTEPLALDWAATLLFYTALHLVDAYAIYVRLLLPDARGNVFRSHLDREEFLLQSLEEIFDEFVALSDLSRDTRYCLKLPVQSELDAYEQTEFQAVAR
jgi:hypothetical protein